jgi:hypothetical protein
MRSVIAALALWAGLVSTASPIQPSCPKFSEYPGAALYDGPISKPVLKRGMEAWHFRTVIREGSKGAPNFNGYLRVVEWGCGSPCHQFAIVNQRNGHVYMVPVVPDLGAAYKLESKLLILDPPSMGSREFVGGIPSYYFVWDEATETLKKLDATEKNCPDDNG